MIEIIQDDVDDVHDDNTMSLSQKICIEALDTYMSNNNGKVNFNFFTRDNKLILIL